MAIADDFSFPKLITTTTNNSSNSLSQFSISSQSMWRVSSLIHPHNGDDDDHKSDHNDDKDRDHKDVEDQSFSREVLAAPRKHKSFSELETGDSEARMDLLWQDFNEKELKRVSSLDGRIKSRSLSRSGSSFVGINRSSGVESGGENLPDRREQVCFAPGLSLFKVSHRRTCLVRSKKKTSTVVFLRALRKFFSVHNSGREKKRV